MAVSIGITGITPSRPCSHSCNHNHLRNHYSSSVVRTLQMHNRKRLLNMEAQCTSSTPPPPPGESNSRAVLDAFFIGKAFAEALNERIGTAVGEFLSEIGRLQAEQQKQTRDFQEEVLERAKLAREKAAREALGKGQVKDKTSSSYISSTTVTTDSTSTSDSSSPVDPSSTSDKNDPSNRI